jgi:ankyrin repeat protein
LPTPQPSPQDDSTDNPNKRRNKEECLFSEEYLNNPLSLNNQINDIPLSLQTVLYTLLSKSKFWPKLAKQPPPKSGKGTGTEFLAAWFRGFKQRFNKFVFTETDPAQQSIKQLKGLRGDLRVRTETDLDVIFTRVRENNVEGVRNTLLKGTDVNVRDPRKSFVGLLHEAARIASIEMINMLKAFNPDINLKDETGMTPLFYAVESKNPECVKTILEMGADPNHQDFQTSTPIYWAVYSSTLEILKLLKQYGAKLHVENRLSRTPLLKAAFMCRPTYVEWLLEWPEIIEQINTQDERGRTALHTSCWGSSGGRMGKNINGVLLEDSPECLKLLLGKGADPYIPDEDGNLPIHISCTTGGLKTLEMWKKLGWDFGIKNKQGKSCVEVCCRYDHPVGLKVVA